MSTLWTPSGEHPVPRQSGGEGPSARPGTSGGRRGEAQAPQGRQDAPAADRPPERQVGDDGAVYGDGAPTGREYSEEEIRKAEQEMDAVRQQLLRAPVEVVIANHAMGLWELAALHLSQEPPGLPQAKMAIDAMGSLVEGLSGQLGEAEKTLAEGLSQIRMAFVQIAGAGRAGGPTGG